MSARQAVLDQIRQGVTEPEDMMRATGLTQKQIIRALNNLVYARKIELVERRVCLTGRGQRQGIYRVIEPKRTPFVNSVFNLGAAYAP